MGSRKPTTSVWPQFNEHNSQQTALLSDSKQQIAEEQFEDLIESAFLAGLITGETEALIYKWLAIKRYRVH